MASSSKEADCTEVSEEYVKAAQTIWDYMLMNQTVQKCDVIIALGSNDLRTAEVAADLFLKGMGDWLVMTGKFGNLTKGLWPKSEAEMFCDAAVRRGVPREKIILEVESTNTLENFVFTSHLLKEINLKVSSLVIVTRPTHERRAFATFMKQWLGETECVYVTAEKVTMMEYSVEGNCFRLPFVITQLVGELQRLSEYAECDFLVRQNIPDSVWKCYELLRKSGRFEDDLIYY